MDNPTPLIAGPLAPAQEDSPFSYAAVDADTARHARAVVERYRASTKAYVIDTGRDLIGMKDRLGHGNYLLWLRDEMGLSPRTAQYLMLAAKHLGAKCEIVSHLPPTVMYKLAAAPKLVRERIVMRMERGESVPPDAILVEVKEAREAVKATAAADQEVARRGRLTDEQRAEEDALRARGARGRAARERKAQREREALQRASEAREVERQQAHAKTMEAGSALVDKLDPEWAATFFDRYGDVDAAALVREARAETHRRRAQSVTPTDVPLSQILRSPVQFGWLAPDDRVRIAGRAAEIEREGLTVSPIVTWVEHDAQHPYHPVDGIETIRAFADVLRRETIPVRIMPPIQDAPLATLRRVKPLRPILSLRTSSTDRFGDQRAGRRRIGHGDAL